MIHPACGIASTQPTHDARHSRSPRDSERIGMRMSVSRKLIRRCRTRLVPRRIDTRLEWPGEQDDNDGDRGHDNGGEPPSHRLDQRRDREATDDAAERHARLLDREHEVAVLARGEACQHFAAGWIGGAAAKADAGTGYQRQRDRRKHVKQQAGRADQQVDAVQASARRRSGAIQPDAAGQHHQRPDDAGGAQIADPGLVPAELDRKRRPGKPAPAGPRWRRRSGERR